MGRENKMKTNELLFAEIQEAAKHIGVLVKTIVSLDRQAISVQVIGQPRIARVEPQDSGNFLISAWNVGTTTAEDTFLGTWSCIDKAEMLDAMHDIITGNVLEGAVA